MENNMLKRLLILVSIIAPLALAVSSCAIIDHKDHEQRLTLNFKGTGNAVRKQVPDNTGMQLSPSGMLRADCFSADVFDLKTGQKLGTAQDCLSIIAADDAPSGSGLQVVGTTVFNLPKGKLVVQGLTSVQPVNWPTSNKDGIEFTHITGANSPSNAVLSGTGEFSSTGRFENVEATSRLSGLVNMSRIGQGEITFDCIFVVDLRML